jgi:hypothetical protein
VGGPGVEGGIRRDGAASWLENRDLDLLGHSLNSCLFFYVPPHIMKAAYGLWSVDPTAEKAGQVSSPQSLSLANSLFSHFPPLLCLYCSMTSRRVLATSSLFLKLPTAAGTFSTSTTTPLNILPFPIAFR